MCPVFLVKSLCFLSTQLQLWDTAGMEQFRSALVTKYYRNADGKVPLTSFVLGRLVCNDSFCCFLYIRSK